MTGTTIFENYKTHETVLAIGELFDTNTPSRFMNIDGTSYIIVGWNDNYVSGDLVRYVQLSTESWQSGLSGTTKQSQ